MIFNADIKTGLRFGSVVPGLHGVRVCIPKDRLPAFQIKREFRPENITIFRSHYTDGSTYNLLIYYADLASNLYINTVTETIDGVAEVSDRIIHVAQDNLSSDLHSGNFYIELSDGIETWYSQWFLTVKCAGNIFTDMPEMDITR